MLNSKLTISESLCSQLLSICHLALPPADVVTKILLQKIIPKCGLPQSIQSDNGPTFIYHITQQDYNQSGVASPGLPHNANGGQGHLDCHPGSMSFKLSSALLTLNLNIWSGYLIFYLRPFSTSTWLLQPQLSG